MRFMLRDDLIAVSVWSIEMLLKSRLHSIGEFLDLFRCTNTTN